MKLNFAAMCGLCFVAGILVSLIVLRESPPATSNADKIAMASVSDPSSDKHESERAEMERREMLEILNDLKMTRDKRVSGSNRVATTRLKMPFSHSYISVTNVKTTAVVENSKRAWSLRGLGSPSASERIDIKKDDLVIGPSSRIVMVADPVNPQPGMLIKVYDFPVGKIDFSLGTDQLSIINPKRTGVDRSDQFLLAIVEEPDATFVQWEGFIKCKRSATCTFTLCKPDADVNGGSIALYVNGLCAALFDQETCSCDVELKAGFNKVEIVCPTFRNGCLDVAIKPKESAREPRKLAPKDLFCDLPIDVEIEE